jgi:alkyl hydroperoxide reductase subunit AhpC
VAKSFGVYDEVAGTAKRALFIVNSAGAIHRSYLSPIGVNPGADGILEALDTIT